jgi:hypothetical protein
VEEARHRLQRLAQRIQRLLRPTRGGEARQQRRHGLLGRRGIEEELRRSSRVRGSAAELLVEWREGVRHRDRAGGFEGPIETLPQGDQRLAESGKERRVEPALHDLEGLERAERGRSELRDRRGERRRERAGSVSAHVSSDPAAGAIPRRVGLRVLSLLYWLFITLSSILLFPVALTIWAADSSTPPRTAPSLHLFLASLYT